MNRGDEEIGNQLAAGPSKCGPQKDAKNSDSASQPIASKTTAVQTSEKAAVKGSTQALGGGKGKAAKEAAAAVAGAVGAAKAFVSRTQATIGETLAAAKAKAAAAVGGGGGGGDNDGATGSSRGGCTQDGLLHIDATIKKQFTGGFLAAALAYIAPGRPTEFYLYGLDDASQDQVCVLKGHSCAWMCL